MNFTESAGDGERACDGAKGCAEKRFEPGYAGDTQSSGEEAGQQPGIERITDEREDQSYDEGAKIEVAGRGCASCGAGQGTGQTPLAGDEGSYQIAEAGDEEGFPNGVAQQSG